MSRLVAPVRLMAPALAAIAVLVLPVAPAAAQSVPQSVKIQGYLSDRAGGPPVPANGIYNMVFEIFDAPVGGVALANAGPVAVTVTNGVYEASIAAGATVFGGSSRYLQITVNGEVLSPRLQIDSTPYALRSESAVKAETVAPGSVGAVGLAPGAVTPPALADGAVTATKIGVPCAEGQILLRAGGMWTCAGLPATAQVCPDGSFLYCYPGPMSTLAVGLCRAGVSTCRPDRTGFADCAGAVTPVEEVCDGQDNDCDGQVDEGACGTCGDGIVLGGEACDDGDTQSGDGCSSTCQVEAGYQCQGEPSVCVGVCGDGLVQAGEACDGADLGGQTCQSLGYPGGTLACSETCTLDTSACTGCQDADADGHASSACGGTDCDDTRANVHPGATEVCDALDNDCDGQTDEGACPVCGNGVREAGEGCDGGDFGGLSCQALGYTGGSLLCNQCTLDASLCTNAVCGNGIVEAGEACDGADLGGQNCPSFGYTGGSLGCSAVCAFDTSGCTGCQDADADGFTSSGCGGTDCNDANAAIRPGAQEVCDGQDNDCDGQADEGACGTCGDGIVLGGESCDDGDTQSGDGCSSACQVEPGYECQGNPSICTTTCGDGVIVGGESCDDGDTQSGDGCSSTCQVEAGYQCQGEPSVCVGVCGDGVVQAGEACDGADLGGQTCQSLGYPGGTLACSETCTLDTSGCTGCPDADADGHASSACGGTDCDDTRANVHPGATEVCDALDNDCDGQTDEGACPVCGNGVREAGEGCDGADFGGLSCQSLGYTGGSLLCNQCTLDASLCTNAVCGNGVREAGEACDGVDLGGQNCPSFGYTGGSLGCSAVCAFDTSGCTGCQDADADGFTSSGCGGTDCNDANAAIRPGAQEVCDGQDNDCDGQADEGACGTCGDGIVLGGESCDDGDAQSGDGCSSACQVEPGYECQGNPSICTTTCGDGIIVGVEACDDGDTQSGDGCSSTCQVEAGYDCQGEPSVCVGVCGDGVVQAGEACDGADLGGQTCQSLGYPGGVLGCSATCTLDTTGCTGCPDADSDGHASSACGGTDCDDTRANVHPGAPEVCDALDNDCDGQTDEGACPVCGNGVREAGEGCDGGDFGGLSCQALGYTGGSLLCNQCTLDASLCTP